METLERRLLKGDVAVLLFVTTESLLGLIDGVDKCWSTVFGFSGVLIHCRKTEAD